MSAASFSGEPGRRVVVSEFGSDPVHAIENHLSIEEQAPPDPATLETTDVIVAVESAAVSWVDLLMTSGQYQHMAQPPYCPGLEYSGVVVWAGSGVENVSVGDAVLSDGLLTGPRSQGAYQRYGGFASYAVAPAEGVLPMPAGFSFDQACNLLGNYETAYHCLISRDPTSCVFASSSLRTRDGFGGHGPRLRGVSVRSRVQLGVG